MTFSFETISIAYGVDVFDSNWRTMNQNVKQITMEFKLIYVKFIDHYIWYKIILSI